MEPVERVIAALPGRARTAQDAAARNGRARRRARPPRRARGWWIATATLIERVLAGDEPINALHIEIDSRCFTLLALYQPMAADLRTIVAAVKINTDLERVGDLAVNIARGGQRYAHAPAGQEADRHPAHGRRSPRTCCATRSTRSSAATWTSPSTCWTRTTGSTRLKTQIFRELLTYMLQDPATIEPALDLILVSRHLERIGDHATNVAEDVIFIVSRRATSGTTPRERTQH